MKNLDVNARRVAAFIFFLLMKNLVRRLLAYTALKILDENVTKVTAFFFSSVDGKFGMEIAYTV